MVKRIKSRMSGEYLDSQENWTEDVKKALEFKDLRQADALVQRLQLQNVVLEFDFQKLAGHSDWNFEVPLR